MGIDLEEEKSIQFKVEDIKNPRLAGGDETKFDFQSPQMKFHKQVMDQMDAISEGDTTWERGFVQLLSAIHNHKTMDDFVRFKLTESIQSIACAGSLYLKQELKPNLDTLAKVQDQIDPNTNWINPDDKAAPQQRLLAARALERFKDPSDALKGLQAYLDKWKSVNLGPDYEWVGWLHKDRKNQWVVTYAKAPAISPTAANLHVLTRASSSGPVAYTLIGELKNGQTTVSQADGSKVLLEGRPVFERK